MKIESRLISYTSTENNLEVSHHVLIQHVGNKRILISHPNLYLYVQTRQSENTSERYAGVISKFYRFLFTLPRFQSIDVAQYHMFASNEDIVQWQAQRQCDRVALRKKSPTTKTIENDADLLLGYFLWLNKSGYPSGVNVQLKTWKANFNDQRLLSYISQRTKLVIDRSTIRALDKEQEQKRYAGLITHDEIRTLLMHYDDPVYIAMFSLAIGTGMRPIDICEFPHLGNGQNIHIQPASIMDESEQVVDFVIESKGRKTRTVKIHIKDLIAVENLYTAEHYQSRAKLYEKRYGHPCPPSILFLTKRGKPVTAKMISDRTGDAKKKAIKSDKKFRAHITFYHTRHWWPTYYLIRLHGENILSDKAYVYNEAAEQAMIDQMGHGTREVTYKHYIDMARILMMARSGWMQDLIKLLEDPVVEFISAISTTDKKDKV
ncbi:tyrosine-type recombinase/integrase [Pseudomonas sp.]|uniref:tyrosine-type recombinase/integrase n=1 Tax=Pseudomonas sp. TaxID=306 RepID=UPI0024893A2F|nr:tyrosine-type recombinase/integrase [Pseudomonas sp.]MDI1333149.1 site-specific integrase [Pseudomonas sp.]